MGPARLSRSAIAFFRSVAAVRLSARGMLHPELFCVAPILSAIRQITSTSISTGKSRRSRDSAPYQAPFIDLRLCFAGFPICQRDAGPPFFIRADMCHPVRDGIDNHTVMFSRPEISAVIALNAGNGSEFPRRRVPDSASGDSKITVTRRRPSPIAGMQGLLRQTPG